MGIKIRFHYLNTSKLLGGKGLKKASVFSFSQKTPIVKGNSTAFQNGLSSEKEKKSTAGVVLTLSALYSHCGHLVMSGSARTISLNSSMKCQQT
jgi:hypothetical protein